MLPDAPKPGNSRNLAPATVRFRRAQYRLSTVKLHLASSSGQNVFTGYGNEYFMVNHIRYEGSLVVLPERIIESWKVLDFGALKPEHFEFLCDLEPEIALLGTGASLRFPDPRLTKCFTSRGIGLEVMDSRAACRTYNILVAEGRRVLAALLPCASSSNQPKTTG